ncbi:3363_t:CDS:2 [Funneliformis mosseae]|uniref:3363_t:CDS:1 n=1 Tax=Funneliformis mosseae TaxID=27381 RepID=A0A9N8WNH2_FUNMO|nr:3363_t:CDS:2 [Funneliformis mosseae]
MKLSIITFLSIFLSLFVVTIAEPIHKVRRLSVFPASIALPESDGPIANDPEKPEKQPEQEAPEQPKESNPQEQPDEDPQEQPKGSDPEEKLPNPVEPPSSPTSDSKGIPAETPQNNSDGTPVETPPTTPGGTQTETSVPTSTESSTPSFVPRPSIISQSNASVNRSFGFVCILLVMTNTILTRFH